MCDRALINNCKDYIYRLTLLNFCILFLLFGNISVPASNTDLKEDIIQKLALNGFENLRVKIADKNVIVAYENRVYRFDAEGVKEVLKIISPELSVDQKIILIPLNRKIPLVVIEAEVSDCRIYLKGELSGKGFAERLKINFNTDEIFNQIKDEELVNSSSFRFDIVLKPQVNFVFGPYVKPVITQINLVPGIKTSWWKGMNLNYEVIIPVFNEFGSREDSVRPGIMALNQVFRFDNDFFISASAGYFTQNRYGIDFDFRKYFMNGDMSFSLNFGTTSIASFSGMTKLYYYDAFKITGAAAFEYRISEYDLTLGISAGKFLMGDESFRFDINREFNEIEIGFFAIRSRDGISNGGINISIPLFPSHYWKPAAVRLKSDENFYWSYLVKSDSDQLIGLKYNTGSRLGVYNKKLNPSFIRNFFTRN